MKTRTDESKFVNRASDSTGASNRHASLAPEALLNVQSQTSEPLLSRLLVIGQKEAPRRQGRKPLLGALWASSWAWVATAEAVEGRVCRANSANIWQMTSRQMQPPGGEDGSAGRCAPSGLMDGRNPYWLI